MNTTRRLVTGPAMGAAVALVAVGMASTAESPANEVTELPPDLAQAINAYDRATSSNDVETLGGIVADDYVLVNSDSTMQDKQSYLADFAVPGFKLDPYVMEQPVEKVLGDAAVTGGLLKLSWTLDGERHSRLLRIVHVWARHDGKWQLTYTQLTRVPE
ncbi:MAG: nuclear transport factor 2 family protein [Gammaproteobacteria bacterium]